VVLFAEIRCADVAAATNQWIYPTVVENSDAAKPPTKAAEG
jgi:hypothetical protein